MKNMIVRCINMVEVNLKNSPESLLVSSVGNAIIGVITPGLARVKEGMQESIKEGMKEAVKEGMHEAFKEGTEVAVNAGISVFCLKTYILV